MIINQSNLRSLYIGFRTAFQGGLSQAESHYGRVATTVPSTTREEEYGWLGKIPNVREWIGERVVQNIKTHDYKIKNRPFELTIGVDRDDISDDNLGIYTPLFTEMGLSTAAHRELLVFGLLKAGFSTACYDAQYYFDTDHPVLDEAGREISVANTDGGAGAAWFLIDDKRALKPILFQDRQPWQFVARDKIDDENVFNKREFLYGIDSRHNVGYGFWQFAWGSKQALDAAHYATARAALTGMKGDYGRPLGIVPRLLVVSPTLESAGLKLLNSERNDLGATNEWKGTAELLVCPWLA
jgi:phage major head subunit gpT-like protein